MDDDLDDLLDEIESKMTQTQKKSSRLPSNSDSQKARTKQNQRQQQPGRLTSALDDIAPSTQVQSSVVQINRMAIPRPFLCHLPDLKTSGYDETIILSHVKQNYLQSYFSSLCPSVGRSRIWLNYALWLIPTYFLS